MIELALAYSISSVLMMVDASRLEDLEPRIHNNVDLNSENEIFVLIKLVPVEISTFLLSEIISASRL